MGKNPFTPSPTRLFCTWCYSGCYVRMENSTLWIKLDILYRNLSDSMTNVNTNRLQQSYEWIPSPSFGLWRALAFQPRQAQAVQSSNLFLSLNTLIFTPLFSFAYSSQIRTLSLLFSCLAEQRGLVSPEEPYNTTNEGTTLVNIPDQKYKETSFELHFNAWLLLALEPTLSLLDRCSLHLISKYFTQVNTEELRVLVANVFSLCYHQTEILFHIYPRHTPAFAWNKETFPS